MVGAAHPLKITDMRKRVLIIDDMQAIRTRLRQSLEKAGYEVLETSNGREGLEALQAHSFDLVITDIIMPEMEGIETIMRIRKNYPAMRILAISSGGSHEKSKLLGMARRLGAHDTLAKPFTQEALLASVRRMLGEKPSLDPARTR